MKLSTQQLPQQLKKSLAPVYLISGNEPLLITETCDLIRQAAIAQGYAERIRLQVDKQFQWEALLSSANTLSLFSEKRLIELHLPTGKPGKVGGKALQEYAAHLPPDTLLLIISNKLESQQQKTRWFQALDAAGITLLIWPVARAQFPGWLAQRLKAAGLRADREALRLLVQYTEGHLLAAHQEILKLQLLYGEGMLSYDQVAEAIADHSRFDVFSLAESALGGETQRIPQILSRLRGEGVEPILILWALAREIRALAAMEKMLASGKTLGDVLREFRVWERRKPLITQALKRTPKAGWATLLSQASAIDRVVKGIKVGNRWDLLLDLALRLAGLDLFQQARTVNYA